MSYKVDGPSKLASEFRFTGDNDEFLQDSFANTHVFLHTIEVDGRLKVMIEVGEDSRAVQLRKAIPYALQLREKLMEFQGAWSVSGDNAFFEYLSRLQEGGMTYKMIAEKLRLRVEEHLREAVAFDDEYRKILPALKTQGDLFLWAYGREGIHNKYNPASFEHASSIFELIGLTEEEIKIWLDEGITNIRAGKEPFSRNPITRKKMIEVIRVWRNGKKHKSIRAMEKRYS